MTTKKITMKPSVMTYTLKPAELQDMFANELGVPVGDVQVEEVREWVGYGTNEMQVFGGLKISVKGKK